MTNKLEQLRAMTTVVSDTGDMDSIRAFKPTDATTNPSLILKASEMPAYARLVDEAIVWGRKRSAPVSEVTDRIAVNFGAELTKIVPGRVSTEVDADLSFDVEAMVAKAKSFIAAYDARGIKREHILIKLASTWEGVEAARRLQGEGIDCNMTLIFSLAQAIAAGAAQGLPGLAVRRAYSRLAREGGRRPLRRGIRPWRQVGAGHLRLFQDLRRQDRGHGRFIPQHRRNRSAGGLRPPDHLAAIAGGALQGRGRAATAISIRPVSAPPRRGLRWTKRRSAGC